MTGGSMLLEAAAQALLQELASVVFSRVRRGVRGWRSADAVAARRIAADLDELRSVEFRALDDGGWQAATLAVDQIVRSGRGLDLATVVASNGDADEVARRLSAHGAPVLARAGLEQDVAAAADRILRELCHRVVSQLLDDPRFTSRALAEVMTRLDEVRRRLAEREPDPAEPAPADAEPDFDVHYRETVAGAFARFELYGFDEMPRGRWQGLLTTYVGLAVARWGDQDAAADTVLTGAGVPAGAALATERRVLLRGSAGSGKSTVLRRYVLAAALADTSWLPGTGDDGPPIPFFVELRRYADGPLPAPARLGGTTVRALDGAEPDRWADSILRRGRGVVLLDGLDEVTPEHRESVRTWVVELCQAYPRARVVLTTRRSTVPEGWLDELGFVGYDLLPMTRDGIITFVHRWHDAYVAALGTTGEADRDLYEDRRDRLLDALDHRPELATMAGTPLLCALICVLNHHVNASLPVRRAELYESALRLLLGGWDSQRDVRQNEQAPLDRDERRVLLERIAHALVLDERNDVDRDRACRSVAHETRGMASRRRVVEAVAPGPDADREVAAWSTRVLDWLLERSSVLREPIPGTVEFSHSSFRDYLAAGEFVAKGQFDVLLRHAHHVRWRDVVLMAMSFARPDERGRLLRDLLAGTEASARDPQARQQLELVAAACLRESPSVLDPEDGDDIRDEVLAMLRRWIPPTSREGAELLARAGPVVVDLLGDPEEIDAAYVPFVARTLAIIGGPAAFGRLAELGRRHRAGVGDDLLGAWRSAEDPAEYARTVLADIDFGDRPVLVRNHSRIRDLVHLRRVRYVVCLGDGDPARTVARMPCVLDLEVQSNQTLRTLEPLAGNRTLLSLTLTRCDSLRDVGALADTALRDLAILHCRRIELPGLDGVRIRRLVVAGEQFEHDLEALPADLPALETLELRNRSGRRGLDGLRRWSGLTHVVLHGAPDAAEVAELAALPALARLTLVRDSGTATEGTPEGAVETTPAADAADPARVLGSLVERGVDVETIDAADDR